MALDLNGSVINLNYNGSYIKMLSGGSGWICNGTLIVGNNNSVTNALGIGSSAFRNIIANAFNLSIVGNGTTTAGINFQGSNISIFSIVVVNTQNYATFGTGSSTGYFIYNPYWEGVAQGSGGAF